MREVFCGLYIYPEVSPGKNDFRIKFILGAEHRNPPGRSTNRFGNVYCPSDEGKEYRIDEREY
jgi:hypothetical protein